MALNLNDEDFRTTDLTGRSMPFFNSNVFFTQTFHNVQRKKCKQCQEQWINYNNPLKNHKWHDHMPSYTYVLSVAESIANMFDRSLSQFVIEGTPNFLKKVEAYEDEHKLRGVFSKKDNTRVTRPHIHGFIKYVNIQHLKQILRHTKAYRKTYNKPCSCFYPSLEGWDAQDWVYKLKGNKMEDMCPGPHRKPEIHLEKVGFNDFQPVKNEMSVTKYLEKYLQKDGCEGRIA